MRRFITTPFRAILWREWRESWFALPVAVGCVMAGTGVSLIIWSSENYQLGRGGAFVANQAIMLGIALTFAILLRIRLDSRTTALAIDADLLRMPVGSLGLGALLLSFRLVYLTLAVLSMQAACYIIHRNGGADPGLWFRPSAEVDEQWLGTLLTFVSLFALAQLLAWRGGLRALVLGLAAYGCLWLYSVLESLLSGPDWVATGLVGVGAIAVALAGFYWQRPGAHASAGRYALPAGRAAGFRRMSPLRAQFLYEETLYGAWMRGCCYLLACYGMTILFTSGRGIVWYEVKYRFEFLYAIEEITGWYWYSAIAASGITGLYFFLHAIRIFRGSSCRYMLYMPVSPRAMLHARILVLLQGMVMLAIAWAAIFVCYAAAEWNLGARWEWHDSLKYPVPGGLLPKEIPVALGWFVETVRAISVGLLALPILLYYAVILMVLTVIAPLNLGTFLDFRLEDIIIITVSLIPFVTAWGYIAFTRNHPRILSWRHVLLIPLAFAGMYFASLTSNVDASGGLELTFVQALSLLPVTAYFTWLALFTRMRGR